MSASIYYSPIPHPKYRISTSTPSYFQEVIKDVFGKFPITLNKYDILKLEAIRDLNSEDDEWQQLIEAVQNNQSIEVYAEY